MSEFTVTEIHSDEENVESAENTSAIVPVNARSVKQNAEQKKNKEDITENEKGRVLNHLGQVAKGMGQITKYHAEAYHGDEALDEYKNAIVDTWRQDDDMVDKRETPAITHEEIVQGEENMDTRRAFLKARREQQKAIQQRIKDETESAYRQAVTYIGDDADADEDADEDEGSAAAATKQKKRDPLDRDAEEEAFNKAFVGPNTRKTIEVPYTSIFGGEPRMRKVVIGPKNNFASGGNLALTSDENIDDYHKNMITTTTATGDSDEELTSTDVDSIKKKADKMQADKQKREEERKKRLEERKKNLAKNQSQAQSQTQAHLKADLNEDELNDHMHDQLKSKDEDSDDSDSMMRVKMEKIKAKAASSMDSRQQRMEERKKMLEERQKNILAKKEQTATKAHTKTDLTEDELAEYIQADLISGKKKDNIRANNNDSDSEEETIDRIKQKAAAASKRYK
jgi:hypothetical protein